MIKTLLKHIIYETCIDILFYNVVTNFSNICRRQKMLNEMFMISSEIEAKLQKYNHIFSQDFIKNAAWGNSNVKSSIKTYNLRMLHRRSI